MSLKMKSPKLPNIWPTRSRFYGPEGTWSTRQYSNQSSTEWKGPTGSVTIPRSVRFCLQCPQGFIRDHSLVSDSSEVFTQDPREALGFLTWNISMQRIAVLREKFPGLTAKPIEFEKHGKDWIPH